MPQINVPVTAKRRSSDRDEPRPGDLAERWGHTRLDDRYGRPLVLVRRDSLRPGDVVHNSHYGEVTVASTEASPEKPGDHHIGMTYEGRQYGDRYPGDLLEPLVRRADHSLEMAAHLAWQAAASAITHIESGGRIWLERTDGEAEQITDAEARDLLRSANTMLDQLHEAGYGVVAKYGADTGSVRKLELEA